MEGGAAIRRSATPGPDHTYVAMYPPIQQQRVLRLQNLFRIVGIPSTAAASAAGAGAFWRWLLGVLHRGDGSALCPRLTRRRCR